MTVAVTEKRAVLYRMVMPETICPSGLRAKALLERQGYTVDDRWLRSRDEVDALKEELDVKTTPQPPRQPPSGASPGGARA